MKRWLKYNSQIFKTWFVYILLKKKISNEVVELIDANYKYTPREKRIIERIKRISKRTRKQQ